jgi:hypothetical protein
VTPTAQYPRSRYVAMQVVLFFILLGTVGLAQWVSKRHANTGKLNTPITLGNFTLYLPADWPAEQKQTPGSIHVVAADPDDPSRRLDAIFQRLRQSMEPMDYLLRSGIVTGSWSGAQINADGNPGAYVEMMRINDYKGERIFSKNILACIILPDGQVLTVQLTAPGAITQDDREFMAEILKHLKIQPLPPAATQPALQQWEGI